ncbi:hypothetical protein BGX20_011480 [Mortierella sp. AD010]|nr:hypothetical protein BGX20_011480 [Mortierella sp. AD010]
MEKWSPKAVLTVTIDEMCPGKFMNKRVFDARFVLASIVLVMTMSATMAATASNAADTTTSSGFGGPTTIPGPPSASVSVSVATSGTTASAATSGTAISVATSGTATSVATSGTVVPAPSASSSSLGILPIPTTGSIAPNSTNSLSGASSGSRATVLTAVAGLVVVMAIGF